MDHLCAVLSFGEGEDIFSVGVCPGGGTVPHGVISSVRKLQSIVEI